MSKKSPILSFVLRPSPFSGRPSSALNIFLLSFLFWCILWFSVEYFLFNKLKLTSAVCFYLTRISVWKEQQQQKWMYCYRKRYKFTSFMYLSHRFEWNWAGAAQTTAETCNRLSLLKTCHATVVFLYRKKERAHKKITHWLIEDDIYLLAVCVFFSLSIHSI